MHSKLMLILAICYTLVLAFFSLASFESLPEIGTNYDDKIFHVFAYGMLFLLWYFSLDQLKTPSAIIKAAVFSALFGIIIEVLQGQLTIVRQFDALDVLANSIGILIALLFILIKNRRFVKNI